jgi:peptidoglycan/xylan/chitin deacetylase (PgdA/CDA1 family)
MFDALKTNKELWDMYTKREEYTPVLLDKFKRFPYHSSRHRDVFEPVVSKFLVKNGMNCAYPNNKKFAVCLSHDIDIVYSPFLKIAHEIKIDFPKPKMKINSLWNFSKIMDIEKKYNAKSTFFFMAMTKNDSDFNYNPNDLGNWLGKIVDSGWEVGLHGGQRAYNDLGVMKNQKQRLEKVMGKKVAGYRNHLMKFQTPLTWELIQKAGFKYDSTYGYNDCVGFRNGMCHPFRPYDLNSNHFIDLWEIPLTIMDSTFDYYMRLDKKDEWNITKKLIDTVQQLNGVITILWHNTNMSGDRFKLYENILKYCSDNGAWMSSAEEIVKFWEKNNVK